MKKIILFLLISVRVFGQNVDYNKIVLPEHTQTSDFGEKLVQIAWRNNPLNESYRRQVTMADLDVRANNATWLGIVKLTGNLNQFTLNPGSDIYGRASFYPKYNVGATISLDEFFTRPYQTKKNKEMLMVAQANVNAQKLAIRNAVLKAYNEFLMREKVYKMQSQLLLDNETSHKLMEQRFKNGETTFENYSISLNNYSTLAIGHLESEKNYKNAKLDLEQLIGMRLEDVR
jgi:outer membrane protein TolC